MLYHEIVEIVDNHIGDESIAHKVAECVLHEHDGENITNQELLNRKIRKALNELGYSKYAGMFF